MVNHFHLVIYTDEYTRTFIDTKGNPRILVVLKPFEQFYNYRYKDAWVRNHAQNSLMNGCMDWNINMLWSEKIRFVKETYERRYFETDVYGWCDIGYFRNRPNDLHTNFLENWGNRETEKVQQLLKENANKICYGCINNNVDFMNYLYHLINDKNEKGLPVRPIPPSQLSIAGGFFLIPREKISWWAETLDSKLRQYFENGYLVKDDQIILVNCILDESMKDHFTLFVESDPNFDNWFMFQRILS